MLETGKRFAAGKGIDSIIGLGGGSSLDCAKGINFLLTQGGVIHDFQGYGKAAKPMLPMIGVPTTAGTGSEAQSYAIISDPRTHQKMACGDPKAAFRAVILDPCLTLTQPASVTATAGYDAIAHAVESFVSTKRTARSQEISLEAWRLLEANYERVLRVARRSRCPRRNAAGSVLRGHRHRALDARRDARLRESRDRAVRHHSWQRHRHPAAARRALERRGRRDDVRRVDTHLVDPHPSHPSHPSHPAPRPSPRGSLRSRVPAICRRRFDRPAFRPTIWLCSRMRRPNSGRVDSIPVRSMRRAPWRFINARCNSHAALRPGRWGSTNLLAPVSCRTRS